MEAGNSTKLIFYFATNCPRRIFRDELSATSCPATNCPRRVVRDELSCDELSGNPLPGCSHHLDTHLSRPTYPATTPVSSSIENPLNGNNTIKMHLRTRVSDNI